MKRIIVLIPVIVLLSGILSSCTKDEDEIYTLGERNAIVLRDLLYEHEIHYVSVYIFNYEINDWELNFTNNIYDNNNVEVIYKVEEHFFVVINEIDNFEQYFNLEYLERMGLVDNDERLELYFAFP